MNNHNSSGYFALVDVSWDLLGGLIFLCLIVVYVIAVVVSNRRYKRWPAYRTCFWIMGVVSAVAGVIGPLARQAHHDFTAHMGVHLLLGMLSPLLIALSAPMTLLFRTVSVNAGRLLSHLLKSQAIRFLTDPLVASLMNVGGLWILYTTNMYADMHENVLLYVLVHLHIFLVGYTFTVSMIYIDPISHRTSFLYRAIVLIFAIAAHSVLAKYIYVHPPVGVPAAQAEAGAMFMYYGGDAVTLIIIYVFCYQWYRSARPRVPVSG